MPNSNDVTCIANIMLTKVPNSNDVRRVANNVRLITMGAQQFSMASSVSCQFLDIGLHNQSSNEQKRSESEQK